MINEVNNVYCKFEAIFDNVSCQGSAVDTSVLSF